ncbi:MAG: hypothetical protein LBU57_06230 [Dysgonamonadaceae bacterium]|jgi:hypothetical protein|nr:hypothetical protein [Dysgonamonadaceae bacterium]
MYQSIFYKEWIKTRRLTGLLFIIFTGLITYIFIDILHQLRTSGAVDFVEAVIQKDIPLLTLMKYLPVLSGVLFAINQYTPEMQNKRFKLTLHLPLPESSIVSAMLGYGFTVMFILLSASFGSLLIGLRVLFPPEIVCANSLSALPWFLAGLAGYLIASWVSFEPVWKYRVLNAIPGICALSFFFIPSKSGGFTTFLPELIAFIIISFSFTYYSTSRFKEGAQ